MYLTIETPSSERAMRILPSGDGKTPYETMRERMSASLASSSARESVGSAPGTGAARRSVTMPSSTR